MIIMIIQSHRVIIEFVSGIKQNWLQIYMYFPMLGEVWAHFLTDMTQYFPKQNSENDTEDKLLNLESNFFFIILKK